ncbi:MAG: phospholipase D-like domain-containing protein [Myxococcota bacterium]
MTKKVERLVPASPKAVSAKGGGPARAEPALSPEQRLWGDRTTKASDGFVGARTSPVAPQTSSARQEIERALRFRGNSLTGLSDLVLAQATREEKVELLKALASELRMQGKPQQDTLRTFQRQEAVRRVLSSAPDAGAFDYLYFRMPMALRSVSGVEKLAVKHRASAKPGDWAGYEGYLEKATGTPSAGKNQVEYLIDGAEFLPQLEKAIAESKHSIHFWMYQWQPDEVGWDLAKKLAAKVKEGVAVRVLIDEQGTSWDDKEKVEKLLAFMRSSGIELVVNPSPLMRNHLDHRKVLIFDGKVGFTGGMNLGSSYLKDWHDDQARIEGPAVGQLQEKFVAQWEAESKKRVDRDGLFPPLKEAPNGVKTWVVNHAGKFADQNMKAAYLRAIATAKSSIRIANAYFADKEVVKALAAAAQRGVKVQLVLPRENHDVPILKRAARSFYPELIAAGVEVYEYTGRMAHQKAAVIDSQWATFGSSNLDARSLAYNDELNAVILDRRFAEDMERRLFEVDLKQSERITQHDVTAKERLARLMAGWL